jgi:hypothetical protein
LILDIPNILQFVHTALKLRLAEFNLAFNTDTGVVSLLAIMIPKYLKRLTVSIFLLYTCNYDEQLTNMALVLPTLISRLFLLQKHTS